MALVYGLHDLETMKDMRVQEIGTIEMADRLLQFQAEHNRVFNAIMDTFAVRNEAWNTTPITRFQLPSAALAQFVDEHGVAKPQRETGYVEQGFPLMRFETAMSFSYEAAARATVEELSRELMRVQRADMATARLLFWFAVFYNTNWTHVSTEDNIPDVPVKAFANNDTDRYVVRGNAAPQAANHYVAQADQIADLSDPFQTDKDTLTQYPGASANDRIVCYVSDATNIANIRALNGFHKVDRTLSTIWGSTVSLVDTSADTFIGFGDEVIGEHESGVLVVRYRDLPANYLAYFNLDAPPPMGIREDRSPALRGLFNINATESSGNVLLSRYRRKIGFAPYNRTGVLVRRIGNSSYAPPSAYAAIPG